MSFLVKGEAIYRLGKVIASRSSKKQTVWMIGGRASSEGLKGAFQQITVKLPRFGRGFVLEFAICSVLVSKHNTQKGNSI